MAAQPADRPRDRVLVGVGPPWGSRGRTLGPAHRAPPGNVNNEQVHFLFASRVKGSRRGLADLLLLRPGSCFSPDSVLIDLQFDLDGARCRTHLVAVFWD